MTLYNDGTGNYYLGTRTDASYANWQVDLQAMGAAALGNTNYFSHNWPVSYTANNYRIAFHPADAVDAALAGISVTSVGVTTGVFLTGTDPSAGWRFATCLSSSSSVQAWSTATGITNTSNNACNKQNVTNGVSRAYNPTWITSASNWFSVMDNRSLIIYVTSDQFSSTASSHLYWIGVTSDNHPVGVTNIWNRSGAMILQMTSGAFTVTAGYGQGINNEVFYSILPDSTSLTTGFLTPFSEAAGQPNFGDGDGNTQTARIITQYYHRLNQPALGQYSPGRVNNLAIGEGAMALNALYAPNTSLGTGNNLWRCVGQLPTPSGSRQRWLLMRAYTP